MATSAPTSVSRRVAPPKQKPRARSARPGKRDYAAIATQYARDVVDGTIVACKWVKLACKRHLDDLKREGSKQFPYVFDAELAARHCSFKEKLPHVKGKWTRPRPGERNQMRLEPWQVFCSASIFGWVHRKTKLRRFTEAYITVARKNGKTADAVGTGLYLLTADDEPGAEVYCAANSLEQAMEVFRPARMVAQALPDLRRSYFLDVGKLSISRLDDGGRFRPLVGIARDGSSPHGTIIDEFHEAINPDQYNSNKNGMMAREQPLMYVITTAGVHVDGPCYNLELEVKRILLGLIENENTFGIVYTLDDGDDWRDLECLKKANPNYGISVLPEQFERALRDAIQQTAKQPEFITKNANMWRNSGVQWIPAETWAACADPNLKIEDFAGEICHEGVDLAAKIDLASRCRIFRKDEDGKAHYYLFWKHYVPEATVIDGSHAHYQRWVDQGCLIAHKGPEIQLELIQEDIESELETYPRACIAFDEYNARQMQQMLSSQVSEDITISIPQQVKYLSDPMKEVEAAAMAGRLHHDGDPLAAWAVSCVQVREDHNGNVFPRKEKNGRAKIDPVSALLNGMHQAMIAEPIRYTRPMIGYL
jgi:phage terminase large subunit-like protein